MTETTHRHKVGAVLANVDGMPVAIVAGYPGDDLTFDPTPHFGNVVDAWRDALDFHPEEADLRRLRQEFGAIAKPAQWFHAISEADFEERGAEAPDWCGPDFDGEPVHVLVLDENDSYDAIARAEKDHFARLDAAE